MKRKAFLLETLVCFGVFALLITLPETFFTANDLAVRIYSLLLVAALLIIGPQRVIGSIYVKPWARYLAICLPVLFMFMIFLKQEYLPEFPYIAAVCCVIWIPFRVSRETQRYPDTIARIQFGWGGFILSFLFYFLKPEGYLRLYEGDLLVESVPGIVLGLSMLNLIRSVYGFASIKHHGLLLVCTIIPVAATFAPCTGVHTPVLIVVIVFILMMAKKDFL
jgi:hypothetical protein